MLDNSDQLSHRKVAQEELGIGSQAKANAHCCFLVSIVSILAVTQKPVQDIGKEKAVVH